MLSRIALVLSTASMVLGQVSWNLADGYAAANIGDKLNSETVLYAQGNSGTRLLYSIVPGTAPTAVPLVTVSLVNGATGKSYELQTGFSTVTQTCSCYWVDAKELVTRFPDIPAGLQYAVRFRSADGKVDLQSGWFGVVPQGTSTAGLIQPPKGTTPSNGTSGSNSTTTTTEPSKTTTTAISSTSSTTTTATTKPTTVNMSDGAGLFASPLLILASLSQLLL